MKKIYINENKLSLLNEEVTFYEFFLNTKSFLKDLLKKPSDAKPSDLFISNDISKDELLTKMKDLGIIKSKENITEVPVEENKTHPYGTKMRAKHTIQYSIPKNRFDEKMHELYKELFKSDKGKINEDGEGGATSCANVMGGGGSNPSAGTFDTPISPIQRRKFWKPSLTRSKDEKNGSITMNRLS